MFKKMIISTVLILLVSILSISTVAADGSTITLNINNYSYLEPGSISVQNSPMEYTYSFVSGYIDDAYPTHTFTFDDKMFRFLFKLNETIATEYPNVRTFSPEATINLPLPEGYYDETYLVFSIVTGLYTNEDKELLLDIIDDVSIVVNGVTVHPISSSMTTGGTYWTFSVSLSDLSEGPSLTVTPNFADYPDDFTGYGNFPTQVWWFLQFSDIIFTGDRSAAAQYAAAIEGLISNELAPSLDNIEDLMDNMTGQQAAANSQLSDLNDKQAAANSQLSDLNESVDQLPDEIGQEMSDALEQQAEAEYNRGTQEGDAAVNNAMQNFPTDSINSADSALQLLAESLGSSTREAKWNMPSIIIPELKDSNGNVIMSEIKLTEPQEIDFAHYFNTFLPPTVIIIVRAFVTLSLAVFVFKEMFEFIQMFKEG